MSDDLPSRAEALLFAEGGTLSLRKLAGLLGVKEERLHEGLRELAGRLEGHGITLIQTETEATLSVAEEASRAVEAAYGKELGKEIGDAGLEVLAIVLYRGPSTRTQIDYIRGVNTGFTIRALLSRGLLERAGNPEDGREYLYRPTAELLAHLGMRAMNELPDYAAISAELTAFEKQQHVFEDNHGNTD